MNSNVLICQFTYPEVSTLKWKKERVIKKWERECVVVVDLSLLGKERRCLNGSIESIFALNYEKEKHLKNQNIARRYIVQVGDSCT